MVRRIFTRCAGDGSLRAIAGVFEQIGLLSRQSAGLTPFSRSRMAIPHRRELQAPVLPFVPDRFVRALKATRRGRFCLRLLVSWLERSRPVSAMT